MTLMYSVQLLQPALSLFSEFELYEFYGTEFMSGSCITLLVCSQVSIFVIIVL
jgi:hypothetical protein